MDKIYSRPRIIIHKIRFNRRNGRVNNWINRFKCSGFNLNRSDKNIFIRKKIYIIFSVIIIAFATMFKMLDGINVIIDEQCRVQAKSIATRISNQQASNVMTKYKYEDLFNIEKDENRECIND